MLKVRPNDPCICWRKDWNWKFVKFKKCYWHKNKYEIKCEKFISDNKLKRNNIINQHIKLCSDEIFWSFKLLDIEKSKFTSAAFILIFSLLDTLSYMYNLYSWDIPLDDDRWVKLKFCNFLEKFCLNKNNEEYIFFIEKYNKVWKISSNEIYKFRCSLVHYFWLKESWITIWNWDLPSKHLEIIQKHNNNSDNSLKFIDPKSFLLIILKWGINFINLINDDSINNNKKYITWIQKLWLKLGEVSPVHISL